MFILERFLFGPLVVKGRGARASRMLFGGLQFRLLEQWLHDLVYMRFEGRGVDPVIGKQVYRDG